MRISDWSSDVCSSDLHPTQTVQTRTGLPGALPGAGHFIRHADESRNGSAMPLEPEGVRRQANLQRTAEPRSAERSVGKEGVSTCRSRWSTYHKKKKTHT